MGYLQSNVPSLPAEWIWKDENYDLQKVEENKSDKNLFTAVKFMGFEGWYSQIFEY